MSSRNASWHVRDWRFTNVMTTSVPYMPLTDDNSSSKESFNQVSANQFADSKDKNRDDWGDSTKPKRTMDQVMEGYLTLVRVLDSVMDA